MDNSCKDCKHDKGKCVGVSRVGSHRYCFEHKEITNADRIRAMSDEELCKFLGEYKFCDICEEGCDACTYNGDCDKRLLEWLKQPAEVDHVKA